MNARGIAYTMLRDICLHKTYSNLLLRKGLNQAKPQDKGLITQIVYGTLQNYRLCRYQWEDCVKNSSRMEQRPPMLTTKRPADRTGT